MSLDPFKQFRPTKWQLLVICFLVISIGSIATLRIFGQARKAGSPPRTQIAFSSSEFWLSVFPWGQQIYQIQASVTNPNVLYATTNRGLFRSANAGMTWDGLWLAGTNLTHASFTQSAHAPAVMYFGIAAGQSGAVFKTVDAGGSWAQVGTDDIKRAVENIQVDSDSPDTVYVMSRLFRWRIHLHRLRATQVDERRANVGKCCARGAL